MNASYSSYEAEIWQRNDAVFNLYQPRGGHTQSEVLDNWLELIQAYSKILPESFTDRSDFLPTISGLAGSYQRYLKASKGVVDAFLDPEKDYIAGYWRQDIPRSILWHLVTNPTATPTLPNYINSLHYQSHELHLPSWSQISRGCTHSILNNKQCGIYPHNPLNSNNDNFKPEMEILNTHNTTPLGEKNPFGAIRPNPHLHITTQVLDFATMPDNRRVFSVGSPIHHHHHRPRVSTEFELRYNLHPLCLVTLDFAPNHNNSHTNQRTLDDDDDDDVKSDLLRSRCQLALVGRYSSIDPLGLVLYPLLPPLPPPKTSGGGSPQHQHFYRVGLFVGPGPGDDMSRLYTEQPPASALFNSLAEERVIFLY
ncbi:hypothetical protein QC763_0056490 [Podospora pseudopauciseta]|uniref:Uncharacterized protein n=1 Tax=Podospora pseudopauciseta TaxID=2093780 RepID=A0ABR0HHM6_9PEZI|nr:hypothetical protein QC763_0056490 [Podospora pseudopauciseta]